MYRLLDHELTATYATVPAEIRNGVPDGVRVTGAPLKWAAGWTGDGPIGILDTGIDNGHPDLAGNFAGRRDYVQDGAAPTEYHPHGTHVAGTACATGQLKGVAPGAKYRDYRVLDRTGWGATEHIRQAIRDAADDGCRVISMSLGSPQADPGVQEAIRYAISKGAVVLAAVGNEGAGRYSYPGAFPEVIGVGAVFLAYDGQYYRCLFSNTNPEVDVMCQGQDVISCMPGGGYGLMSGTSQSAPHAAGVVALIVQEGDARLGRPISENTAWEGTKTRTIDLQASGIDNATGAGLLSFWPSLPVNRRIELTLGSTTMMVDGQPVELDVAPQATQNQRLLIPLRAPWEAAGATVGWIQDRQTAWGEFLLLPGMEV